MTFASVTAASAEPIGIAGYDIVDTPISGSGGWTHTYDGTIVETGIDPVQGGALATYTDGSGTLNDGEIGTGVDQTHLFFIGTRANPVITLHLNTTSYVDTIDVFGGDIVDNGIPGALSGLTVKIGGTSESVSTDPFGNRDANDRITLTGTPLSQIATDTVELRGFTAEFFDQFSITEIAIDGRPAAVPPLGVNIAIAPHKSKPTISIRHDKRVAVAVLSTPGFDAGTTVDRSSLTFGRTGLEDTLIKCGRPRDVSDDGLADLVCTFRVKGTGLRPGDREAILHGSTTSGRALEGRGAVRVTR